MAQSVDWSKFEGQIIELHKRGLSSSQITDNLKKSHPKEHFPKAAERRVRDMVSKFKSKRSAVENKDTHVLSSSNKILVFDIETHPMKAYTFTKWKPVINDDWIEKDWGILSWAAKWLFDDKVMSDRMTEKELQKLDDTCVSKSIWDLIDEAEVLIAHNGAKFDIKRVNTKFSKYHFGVPSPYQMIDTLYHARKRFAITSNRLDYIAQNHFGIEGKMETPKGLWKQCVEGDFDALKIMDEYCQQDVKVLEDVYLQMRAWISPHPNIALLAMEKNGGCPVCLSDEKEFTQTNYNTYVNSYISYRCKGCGHIYRARKSSTPLSSNANLKVSTPK